ncbi:MAG TPA: coproporphyrinogen III oxidase family protein [Deltaproteobacteria bacterium]|nr:coproporphyrinogen III oxidase family protein [Deltaproteobacteria bacterium]
MIIEQFISSYMRHKTSRYFSFENRGCIESPLAPSEPIHLYVHVPFCEQLCPYCSFHRFVYSEPAAREYFQALKKELKMYHDMGFRFSGVYIGGGTPTIDMDELVDVINIIRKLFCPEEISIETNPDRLDKDTLVRLADNGVGRVSVGIQSFNDDILASIGRYEKYGSGARLQERLIRAKGHVDTLNADMIYNFPTQTAFMMESDIEILKQIQPDQITFYPLMISDVTRKSMEHIMGKVDYSKERSFYKMITKELEGLYEPSSAWCFSRKDAPMIDEYIVAGTEYVGVGSGAFGLVNGAIYANTFLLKQYVDRIDQGMLPLSAKKVFSSKEMVRYAFLMELFGLSLDIKAFRVRFGSSGSALIALDCLFFLLAGGIRIREGRIDLTRRGRYYWVTMMREFFIGVDNFRDLSREAAGIVL